MKKRTRSRGRGAAVAAAALGLATLGSARIAGAHPAGDHGGAGAAWPHGYGSYGELGAEDALHDPYRRVGGEIDLDIEIDVDRDRVRVRRPAARRRGPGTAAPVRQAVRRFRALDRDRDGRLFRKETRAWLARNFDRIDRDATQSITVAEVTRAIARQLRRGRHATVRGRVWRDGHRRAAPHHYLD